MVARAARPPPNKKNPPPKTPRKVGRGFYRYYKVPPPSDARQGPLSGLRYGGAGVDVPHPLAVAYVVRANGSLHDAARAITRQAIF